jgi:hypothetical protein
MSQPHVSHAGTGTDGDKIVIKNYEKMLAALVLIQSIMINNLVNYDDPMVIYMFAVDFTIEDLLSRLSELKPGKPGYDVFIRKLLDFITKITRENLPTTIPEKMQGIIKNIEEKKEEKKATTDGFDTCKHGHECTHMPCDYYHPCLEVVVMMLRNFINEVKKAKKAYIDAQSSTNDSFLATYVSSMSVSKSRTMRSQSNDRHGSHSQTPRGQGSGQYQGKRSDRSSSRDSQNRPTRALNRN